jgi:hypothetical protein
MRRRNAKQLGQLGTVAVRASELFRATHEQFKFGVALGTLILIEGHID